MHNKLPDKKPHIYIFILCFASYISVLLLGLWPFNFQPENKVEWLENSNGLSINSPGIVHSLNEMGHTNPSLLPHGEISIEIWLKPLIEPVDYVAFILSFYSNENPNYLLLGQWRNHLTFKNAVVFPVNQYEEVDIATGVHDVMPMGKTQFLTITSNSNSTAVYVNSELSYVFPNLSLIDSRQGKLKLLLVGNSSTGDNQWIGNILGIAMYNRSLTESQVSNHYQHWIKKNYKQLLKADGTILFYPFDEHSGVTLHNHLNSGQDLYIPKYFQVLKKSILSFPLQDPHFIRHNYRDIIMNILGFIPLGFLTTLYFWKFRQSSICRSFFIVIIIGGSISLFIELIQVYIHTRNSSLPDLLCNILGTALGVFIFKNIIMRSSLLNS